MARYAELYNGTVLEFPDDTPDEVISRVAREQTLKLNPPETPVRSTERTVGEAITDVPVSALSGVGSVLKFPGQLVSLVPGMRGVGEALSAPGEAIYQAAQGLKSEGLKVREALRSEAISEAEKDGILSAFATAITSTLKDPALISTFIGEQLPMLLPPAAAARVAQIGTGTLTAAQAARRGVTAAVGTGAAMQAADISEGAYKRTLEAGLQQGMSPEEAESAANQAARLAAVGAGATSLLAQKLPGAKAIEERLARVPGTSGRLKSGFGEATSESLEEAGGQIFANLGVRTVDPTQSLTEGVGAAAGFGALGGGFFGTLLGKKAPTPLVPGQREGESIEQAVSRLVAERDALRETQLPSGILGGTELAELASRMGDDGRPLGYGLLTNYIEKTALLPDSPAKQQSIEVAESIRQRLNIEEIQRQKASQTNIITSKDLMDVGFTPQDPVYRSLVGKDLFKPEDAQTVIQALDNERKLDLDSERTALVGQLYEGVSNYLDTLPGSGFYAPERGTDGRGVEVSDQRRPVSESRPPEVDEGGVDSDTTVSGGLDVGEEAKQPALRFMTEKGSFYEVDESGNTARTKLSPGKGQGTTYDPHPVLYVSPENLREIQSDMIGGMGNHTPRLGYRQDFETGSVFKPITSRSEIPEGAEPYVAVVNRNNGNIVGVYPAQLNPEVGLHPVEKLYKDGKSFTHLGNKITELVQDFEIVTPKLLKDLEIDIKSGVAKRVLGKKVEDVLEDLAKAAPSKKSLLGIPEAKFRQLETEAKKEKPIQKVEKEPTEEELSVKQKIEDLNKQIEGLLRQVLNKYGLKDVSLKIVKDMAAKGEFSGRLIKLADDTDNPLLDLRHETIHALKELGFFSPAQWKTLEDRAKKEWIDTYLKNVPHDKTQSRYDAYKNMFESEGLTEEGVEAALIEEAIADAFSFFAKEKAPPGLMNAIKNRMQNLFKAIKEFLGTNNLTAEDIFGKIEEGKLPPKITQEKKDEELQSRQPSLRPSVRGDEGVEQDREPGDRGRRDQGRAIAPLAGSPSVPGFSGPDPRLVEVAEKYAKDNGIKFKRQSEYVDVDPDRAQRIASAYEEMAHDPQDPVVREAYENLIQQTLAQYKALEDAGYRFWFIDLNKPDNLNYVSSPWNAMRDIRATQSMGVFPTDEGFGTSGFNPEANPLLMDTGLQWPVGGLDGPLKSVLANDVFRAVHDAFGHGLEGAGFRARGEENAWQAHVRLFTGSAVGAITSETRGQNSWLNYGPYGEQNRNAKVEDTIFADQKTGLMPSWTWTEGIAPEEQTGIVLGTKQPDAVSFEGVHYGKAKVNTLLGAKYGEGMRGAERRRLDNSFDNRIKKRVYFYIARPDGSMPSPESGVVGNFVYRQKLDNILGPGPEMSRIDREVKRDANDFESAVIDAGYDGYAIPEMGVMVILNHDVPVEYSGTRDEVIKKKSLRSQNGVPRSTRLIMESSTPFAQNELGLRTEKPKGATGANNVRDIAQALNNQTIQNFGEITREQLSAADANDLARALADEVGYQLRATAQTGTGLGWYSNNYPKAIDRLSTRFPELKNNKTARSVFTACVAISSNGEDVTTNIKNAILMYEDVRAGKKIRQIGARRADALQRNKEKVIALLNRYGDNFTNELLKTTTVKEMNAGLRALGEKPDTSYLANTTVPVAAIYFGPKLGAFYANLMGAEGYLTMDMWWTRTMNRMRGLLMPEATQSSINKFQEMIGVPGLTRQQVVDATIPFRNKYEAQGYTTELEFLAGKKEPAKKDELPAWTEKAKLAAGNAYDQLEFEHRLEKMANTIYKNEFEMLQEAPFTGSDRAFMYKVARDAQKILKQEGIDLSLADIQAAIWYYEKRLYAKLSGRLADDIGYDEAISRSVANNRRARPSLVFPDGPNSGYVPPRRDRDTDQVRGEPEKAKLSIRSQTQTPAFKQWFGDSKVVDENGEPLVVYHGTGENITVFDESKQDKRDAGFWFANAPIFANQYAAGKKGGNVMPVFLSIQNPKIYYDRTVPITPELIKKLEAQGYDGIIRDFAGGPEAWRYAEGQREYAAFRPTQIKSAIGNVGTFDVTDPDIRRSLREERDLRVRWTDNRIERLLDINAYLQSGREKDTKGFATAIRPNDFLNATASREQRQRIAEETKPLDPDKLAQNNEELYLDIKPTDEKGVYQITGHEGRHRMTALMNAGYNTPVPVVLRMPRSNAVTEEEVYLKPQKFRMGKELVIAPRGIFVSQMIPINWDSRNELKEVFGGEADLKFSLRSNIRSQTPPQILNRIDATIGFRDDVSLPRRMMNAISPRLFSEFRANAIHRYNELAEVDKRYVRAMGGTRLLADSSAEAAALFSDLGAGLTASALGVHDRVGGIPVYRNGVTVISNVNNTVKGPLAIFAPLAKYGDPEIFRLYQFWASVKRGSRLAADGKVTPFNDPNDVAYARQLEQQYPEFVSVQRDWTKYNDGLVDFMETTGIITPEASVEFKAHGDYFPFYRYAEFDDVTGPRIFASIANVPVPKKLKGGEAPLGDFFENVIRNTQSAIQMGIKNIAAQKATKLTVAIGEVTPLPFKPPKITPDVYRVLENGKEKYYRANDMLFINAIKSLNIPDLPFIGLLSAPANVLRNLVTKTPDFMMANMLRDSVSAWGTSGKKITPVIATFKNFVIAIAEKSPELTQLLNGGVLGGYDYAQGVEVSGKRFAKDLRKISKTRTDMEKLASPFTSIWEALEKGSAASDAATRMEVYKKTLQETGNEAEALYQALEVMNFNRKGRSAVIRILTAAVPFLNARIQGLDLLYRAGIRPFFDENATDAQMARAKTFWVRGMTIMALSAMYWAAVSDDDDWKKQEQETRDNYWILPEAGIKIPIPFEIGVMFKVIPERILEYSFGDDTGKDFLTSMKRQLVSTFAFNPIPQTFLPIVESATNHSFFTQRPIISQGMEGVAAEYQAMPTTSRAAIGLADGFNSIMDGLPPSVKKEFAVSPIKLEHLIQGYTGSMGTYALQLLDYIIGSNSEIPSAETRFERMPVIRRFLVDPQARGQVTAYYDLKNATDEVVRTSNYLERTANYEDLSRFMSDNYKMLANKDYIRDLEKTMKEFREMKVMIQSSRMSRESKRSALDSIEKMELQLTKNISFLKK